LKKIFFGYNSPKSTARELDIAHSTLTFCLYPMLMLLYLL
jgi:hypothetical protein